MTLTDDERATIAEIERTHPQREHIAMVEAVYRAGFAAGLAAIPREPTQGDKAEILYAMVEGLHAMIYGVYSTNSGDYAREALGDGGSLHEYVHKMMLLLPPRCLEQVQSGGDAAQGEKNGPV